MRELSEAELKRALQLQRRLRRYRALEKILTFCRLQRLFSFIDSKLNARVTSWYAELQVLYDKKFGPNVFAPPCDTNTTGRQLVLRLLNRNARVPSCCWKTDPEIREIGKLVEELTGKNPFAERKDNIYARSND